MTTKVETRCTQCDSENTNREQSDDLRHNGRSYGVERLHCETCGEVTLQNRRGQSVPRDGGPSIEA